MTDIDRLQLSPERLKLLDRMLREEGIERSTGPRITPRPDPTAPVPLTASQAQMWFLEQMTADSSVYVISGALRVSGDFDIDAFRRACAEVVRRHESLRTVFVQLDGRPMQQVRADLPPEINVYDLPGLSADALAAEVRRREAELASRRFDLTTGPLLRIELLRTGPGETIVLLAMHHIVSDLWSLGVLMRELMALYSGATGGLPELRVQYPDFALWQHESASADGYEADLAYWRQRLQGAPAEISLPTDRPRPAEQSYRGGTVPVELSPALTEQLRALAREQDATLFMVLLAAFGVLLYRLGGDEDIVIGSPVAGRSVAELEPLIGYFVNTLVLRADLSGNPTFQELVGRVSQMCLEAYDHQNLPFDRLVEQLRPERNLAYNPVFQVRFAYQNTPLPRWESGSLQVEPIPTEPRISKVDLTLELFEDGPSISGRLMYRTDLFEAETVRGMARYLHRLLREFAADPTRRIGEICLLDEDERREALSRGYGETVVPPAVGGVHELVAEQVARQPDAVAVVCGDTRLTYRELDERANQLAGHLRTLPLEEEPVVALCLPAGVDAVVGMLAAWRAGAAYLPLDPSWPADRLAFVLADSGAAAVASRRGVVEDLPADRTVWLDDLGAAAAPATPPVTARPDRLAYVIYTSGSTGTPKGVQITHGALLNYLAGVPGRIGFGEPGGRYALLQGMVTDFGNTLIFTSLVTGGTLHVLPSDTATDPAAVADYLVRHEIDYLKVVPSHLAALTAERGAAGLMPARALVLGGEAASAQQVAELLEAAGDRVVANHYGPTETTIGVATVRLTPEHLSGGRVPIGTPVPNTRLYVLDPYLNPVPVGVAGELFVGGPQVAKGYRHRPELTDERFVPDPFAGDGSRMYRTGDRVRWTGSGLLEFLGRFDDQIKIRGYRVEPREIEDALAAHPLVARAVVVLREDVPGTRQLVGYVTPAGEGRPDPVELRALVGRTLPEHMVPTAVVVLDQLPLTANGKVDRRTLPAPEATATTRSRPPATPAEKLLCEIFAQVLGVSDVGAEDGFFELGGDSIQAIHLVSRARAAGLSVSTRDVFMKPTPAGLAAVAEAARQPAVVHDDGTGDAEPMPAMERLRQMGVRIDQYSHAVVVPVPAAAGLDQLAAALQAVVDHHGALRSRLVTRPDGTWSLSAGSPGSIRAGALLRRVDGADLDESRLRELLATQTAEAAGRLDPAAGVMVQAVWVDTGADRPGRLLLVVHHLVVDGVSWRILLSDLRTAWDAGVAGRPVKLPAVGTSPKRWAEVLATEARRPERLAELPAWQAILDDDQPLVLGAHDPNGKSHRLAVTLPVEDTAPLLAGVPAAFGAGVQDVLLAAFGIALAEWRRRRGGPDRPVVVEVEGHGRDEQVAAGVDLTRAVGWFTTVYPVRLDPRPVSWHQVEEAGTALREAVQRLAGQVRAVPSGGFGYGLLRYLNPQAAAELGTRPQPQVVFNYLGQVAVAGDPLPWQPMAADAAGGPGAEAGVGTLLIRPLALNALAYDDGRGPALVAAWTWADGVLQESAVSELAEMWLATLKAITACAGRLGENLAAAANAEDATASVPAAGDDDPIPTAERGAGLPLSFAQLNNVLQPVGADTAHHNVIVATVLRGELDPTALRRSLDQIAQRHEVLRTRVIRQDPAGKAGTDGSADASWGWIQVPEPVGEWLVQVVDLRGQDEQTRTARLRDILEHEQQHPFRLAEGRPVRAVLVQMTADEWVLFVVMHHIVIDPWGYGVFQHELTELYQAYRAGREPRLPQLPIQYADFAAWQQQRLAAGVLDEHVAYWRELLAGLPPALAFDAPAGQKTAPLAGYTQGVQFDEPFTRALKATARRIGVTPFMLLLAAYHALLATYADSDDICVCFPVAGRERPDIQHLIGYFICELFVRADQSQIPTFAELVARVRDGTLDAHTHQEAPLRLLDSADPAAADPGRYDPFRVMFNLVNYDPVPFDLPGVQASFLTGLTEMRDESVIPELVTAMRPHNLDIYLIMHERDEQLRGLWLYSPERIDPQVMGAITRAWPVLLDQVVQDPEISLAELRRRVRQA